MIAAVVGLDEVAYRSTDAGASFQALPTPPSVRAMSARGSTLYVVADNVADGYAVGTSVDEGQSWQPLMRYDQLARDPGVREAGVSDRLPHARRRRAVVRGLLRGDRARSAGRRRAARRGRRRAQRRRSG